MAAQSPFSYGGNGARLATRKTPMLSIDPCKTSCQFENYYHGPDDQDSTPSTPSLIADSSRSRSTSSSVYTCEHCNISSQACRCREASDHGSVDFRNLDLDSNISRSPNMSPSSLSHPKKEAVRFPKSLFQPQVEAALLMSRSRSGRSSCSQAPSDINTNSKAGNSPANLDRLSLQASKLGNSPFKFQVMGPGNDMYHDHLESDESEEDDDELDDDDEEVDDDWSGQDTSLECVILEAVGGDLALAAQLIPVLHKSFYCEFSADITQKVAPWRNGITKYADGDSSQDHTTIGEHPKAQQSSNPRKRQRRIDPVNHNRDQDDDEDEEDEDERDPNGLGNPPDAATSSAIPRLACPFYKRDPTKYCIQHDPIDNGKMRVNYRSCEGPGFNSIQRLKEHLKRKHYPVQCDRCYLIFIGADRADCVLKLESHRQLTTPCERGLSHQKEGISDAQWASLDKKKNAKRNQATSRIEKYWEIWAILFPGIDHPETPWYDNIKPSTSSPASISQESIAFSDIFNFMLNLQVSQKHIRFPEGFEQENMARVQSLVQKAFSIYVGVHGLPASTSSSSTKSRPQSSSVFSSSCILPSTPRTSDTQGSNSPLAKRAVVQQQAPSYTMDMQTSPQSNPMLSRPQNHRHSINGPYLNMNVPDMSTPQFVPNPMNPSMQRQQTVGFQMDPQGMNAFNPNAFNVNGSCGPASGGWYMQVPYGTPDQGFNGAGNGQFASALDQTLMDESEAVGRDLEDWDPRRMR